MARNVFRRGGSRLRADSLHQTALSGASQQVASDFWEQEKLSQTAATLTALTGTQVVEAIIIASASVDQVNAAVIAVGNPEPIIARAPGTFAWGTFGDFDTVYSGGSTKSLAGASTGTSSLAGEYRNNSRNFHDDFNRANGPVGNGWADYFGVWSIASNVLTSDGAYSARILRDSITADVHRVKVTFCSGYGAIIWGWEDGNNFCLAAQAATDIQIYNVVAGSWENVGSFAAGANVTLSIEHTFATGNIRYVVNDTLKGTYNVATRGPLITRKIGLNDFQQNSPTYDEFWNYGAYGGDLLGVSGATASIEGGSSGSSGTVIDLAGASTGTSSVTIAESRLAELASASTGTSSVTAAVSKLSPPIDLEGASTGTSDVAGTLQSDLAATSTGTSGVTAAESKSSELASDSIGICSIASVAIVASKWVDLGGAATGRSGFGYLRRNSIQNPNAANAATLWDGWAGVGGAATITRIVDVSGPVGNTAARMTWTADTDYVSGGIFQGANTASSPVLAGQTVSLSGYVRCSVSQRLGILLVPYDASGVQLPSVPGDHTALVAADTWTRLSDIFVLPALSAHLGFGIYTWSWG